MDNLWLLLLGVFALIILAALALPMFRRQAPVSRKPESREGHQKEEPDARKLAIPKGDLDEEFAEEVAPVAPQAKPIKREEIEEDIFIPHYYGVDRMVLAAKDPNWLYVYWEVSEHKRHKFFHDYGETAWHTSQQVLRIYDITGLSILEDLTFNSFQEIVVDPFADNWFIEVGQADRCFMVELGRRLADGRYVKLLTSNMATTPRSSLSNKMDQAWLSIDEIYQGIARDNIGSSEVMMGKGEEGLAPLGFSSPGYKQ